MAQVDGKMAPVVGGELVQALALARIQNLARQRLLLIEKALETFLGVAFEVKVSLSV